MDKLVCYKHFNDRFIQRHIQQHGEMNSCDHCEDDKQRRVMSVSDVAEFVEQGIRKLYDDPAEWLGYDSREGGYQGDTYTTLEILSDHAELETDPWKLIEEISWEISSDDWCEIDPYGDSGSDVLIYSWSGFVNWVKHQQRFTLFLGKKYDAANTGGAEILIDIGSAITDLELIKVLPARTNLFRCRQHHYSQKVKMAKDITSPPEDKATANRMSPAGVSMFYGAFEKEVAIRETIDEKNKKQRHCSMGTFSVLKDMQVIDLTELPAAPSMFSKQSRRHFHLVAFLRQFVADISQPIERNNHVEHISYVPTQIVIEYFRYMLNPNSKKNLQGVIYPSAKVNGGKNIVLFLNQDDSLEKLQLVQRSIKRWKL